MNKRFDEYYQSNKVFANVFREAETDKMSKTFDKVPFAGANNKFSSLLFTNRNAPLPYSEAMPDYLRLSEKESKCRCLTN